MLFSSFGHRVLLIFGFFLTATTAVVAAKIGWLGDRPHQLIEEAWEPLQDFYDAQRQVLNPAFWLIGFSGSLLAAIWTVHKGWHYAERNLPSRINNFNARWKAEIEEHRPQHIPALVDGISIALPVDPLPNTLKRLILWFHDPSGWALARSRELASRYEDDLSVLTTSRVRCRAQLISAHLDVGARLSRARKSQEALDQFEKALRFNRSDMDALELAARQAHASNQPVNACRHLDALAEAAATSGNVLRRTRALRFKAEVLKGGLDAQRVEARNTLKSVVEILRAADVPDGNSKTLELCLTYGLLADVQTLRNTLSGARTALNQATARFNQLDRASNTQIYDWLEGIVSRLAQAEHDRDRDNEKDEGGQND